MDIRARTLVLAMIVTMLFTTFAHAGPTVPTGLNFEVSNSTFGGVGGKPAIDHDDTNFTVVWLDGSLTVRAARVTSAGSVLDSGGIALGPGDKSPSIAYNGTDYLVVWVEGTQIHGAKLGTDGTVAPGSPFTISATANAKSRMISLAFDGTNYLVTWRTNSDHIRAARVTTAGVNLDDPTGFEIGTGFYPWVAFDGTNYMITWHKWGTGLDIWANRVTPAGAVLDTSGFVVSGATGDQDHSSIAYGDGVYLVTWNDTRGASGDTSGNGHDIRSARISTAGTVLDTTAIIVAERARAQVAPNTQFDGTDFLVVWQVDLQPVDHRAVEVYGRRVSSAGTVLDVQGIPVSTAFHNQFGPRVGYGAGKHLVVWEEDGHCNNCMWGQMLTKGAETVVPLNTSVDEKPSFNVMEPNASAVTWTTESQPTALALQTIRGVDGDDVFSGGSPEPLYHWDGSSWSSITYPAPGGTI